MNINKIGETLVEFGDFSGVIQISCCGKTKLHIASGFANRSDLIRNELDTRFGIASGTKGFTALGVMKLVEAGKIKLDDNVFDYLSQEFPNMKEVVTVRHLLTHTSGIYDYFDEEVVEDFTEMFEKVPLYNINGPKDMMPLLIDGESYFKPGENFKYCNSAFVILGILIEEVSGMSYAKFIDEEILKPYGLHDTGCFPTNALPKNTALGYEQGEDGHWYSNIFSIPKMCTADGGLMTTTYDMARLWDKLVNNEILSKDLTQELLKEQVEISDDKSYGLGFFLKKNKDGEISGYHLVGGDPGLAFYSEYNIADKTVITIISNTAEGVWELFDKIAEYLYN